MNPLCRAEHVGKCADRPALEDGRTWIANAGRATLRRSPRISTAGSFGSAGASPYRVAITLLALALLFATIPDTTAADTAAVTGIVEPLVDLTVASPVAGIVRKQHFKEGEFARQGQVIVELDKRLEELELDRRALVATNRQTDWEATTKLYQNTKSVSKEELEKRELECRLASVERDVAAEQLRRRDLLAPVSGTITEFLLDVGEACQPYQPMLRLVDTRQCYFVVNVEARQAVGLRLNQAANLELETGAAPVRIQGRVVFISPVADPGSSLVRVKVLFENGDNKVRPGLAGRILLEQAAP